MSIPQIVKTSFLITLLTISLLAGFSIARHKPLWLDEIYTQTKDVEALSWKQIWSGQIVDRSNCPLFFSLQKVICKTMHYESVDLGNKENLRDRIIMRICPVIFMSLAITMIIWYFLNLEGIAGAGLAFVLIITSYMIWGYWAETRPYALILFGTAWQAIALDKILNNKTPKPDIKLICGSHCFLALTSVLSIISITATSLILWLAEIRRWGYFIFGVILPVAIISFFYSHSSPCKMWFSPHGKPIDLILINISDGRLGAIFIFPIILLALAHLSKKTIEKRAWHFTLWTWMMLAGNILLLAYMKTISSPVEAGSAEVTFRYFIPLTSVGIMAMLVLSFELLRQAKNGWMKWLVWGTILIIALPRLSKAWKWAMSYHLFDFLTGTPGGSS